MPVQNVRKLRPVHQFLKTDPAGNIIPDQYGAVQNVTEDFDDNDVVDSKHITSIPFWDEKNGYEIGDIVSLDGASYINVNAIAAPTGIAVNTFDDADWESPLQAKNLPIIPTERILGRRSDAGAGEPQALTAAEARTVLFISEVRNTYSKFDNTRAPTSTDDISVNVGSEGIRSFTPGSLWVDVTNDKSYVCLDNAADNAVWTEITLDTTYVPAVGTIPATDPDGIPNSGDETAEIPAVEGLLSGVDKDKLDNAVQSVTIQGATEALVEDTNGNVTIPADIRITASRLDGRTIHLYYDADDAAADPSVTGDVTITLPDATVNVSVQSAILEGDNLELYYGTDTTGDADVTVDISGIIASKQDILTAEQLTSFTEGLSESEVDARVVSGITGKQDTLTTAELTSFTEGLSESEVDARVVSGITGKQDTLTTEQLTSFTEGLSESEVDARVTSGITDKQDTLTAEQLTSFTEGLSESEVDARVVSGIIDKQDTLTTEQLTAFGTEDFTGQDTDGNYTVPTRDTGATTTKFLREDGDWTVPSADTDVALKYNVLLTGGFLFTEGTTTGTRTEYTGTLTTNDGSLSYFFDSSDDSWYATLTSTEVLVSF